MAFDAAACFGGFEAFFRSVAVRGNGRGGHRAEATFEGVHYAGEGDTMVDAIVELCHNADAGLAASFPQRTTSGEVVKVTMPLASESRPFPAGPSPIAPAPIVTRMPFDSRSDAQKAADAAAGKDSRTDAQKAADAARTAAPFDSRSQSQREADAKSGVDSRSDAQKAADAAVDAGTLHTSVVRPSVPFDSRSQAQKEADLRSGTDSRSAAQKAADAAKSFEPFDSRSAAQKAADDLKGVDSRSEAQKKADAAHSV